MAAALRNLKYNVDIVNYDDNRPVEYERYDLLIGFGTPVINSFAERYKPIKVISYLAGMHNYVQNLATLQRVEDVYHKRHAWLLDSGRFVAHDWTSISLISDATIALGNEVVAETYQRYTNKPLFILPSLYYELYDFREIVAGKDFSVSIKHFLWFGGSGLIHKGLDLVLETFADQPDLHLHICGPLQVESAFEACYHQRALCSAQHSHLWFYHAKFFNAAPVTSDMRVGDPAIVRGRRWIVSAEHRSEWWLSPDCDTGIIDLHR